MNAIPRLRRTRGEAWFRIGYHLNKVLDRAHKEIWLYCIVLTKEILASGFLTKEILQKKFYVVRRRSLLSCFIPKNLSTIFTLDHEITNSSFPITALTFRASSM